MLQPPTIVTSQFPVALKPTLGFEQQLYISTQNYQDLGFFAVVAPNSGVATMSVPGAAALGNVPQELLVMLDADVTAANGLMITVSGLDGNNTAGTWAGTFQPPKYAQDQAFDFPYRYGLNLLPQNSTAATCKVIQNITISGDAPGGWVNANLRFLGMPSLSTFILIGTKVSIDLDPKVPMPTAIQNGRDRGAFIKGGEIDIGQCDITVKEPTSADGISRYRGKRVTGWVRETKEQTLDTQYIFLCGLIMTPKQSIPEGQEPVTQRATGMFEKYTSIPAPA